MRVLFLLTCFKFSLRIKYGMEHTKSAELLLTVVFAIVAKHQKGFGPVQQRISTRLDDFPWDTAACRF